MHTDPLLSLAIDNCFASKRWTRPEDWMALIKDLGLTLVEASADTECDPLYMGEEVIRDWTAEVNRCSDRFGVRVANLYSGHGTYATLGLTHTDPRVRARMRDQWVKAHARSARALGGGLGFFAHAFAEPVLQEPVEYRRYLGYLYDSLADLARYAAQIGLPSIALEQMYSPHQPPWTIQGASNLLEAVYRAGEAPFYLTLDLGHMNGQQYFQMPSPGLLTEWIERLAAGQPLKRLWLGPAEGRAIFRRAIDGEMPAPLAVERILSLCEVYPFLFALPEDGSVHAWLRALAPYSPIIHLQQSDGRSSPHWPFSPEYNARGIIKAEEIFRDIAAAYAQPPDGSLPPRTGQIILTLEPFIGTAGNPTDALEEIAQSIQYWRQFIPRDGMPLSEVMRGLAC